MATFDTAYRYLVKALELQAPAPLPRDDSKWPQGFKGPARDNVEALRAAWTAKRLEILPQGCANLVLLADWCMEFGQSAVLVERSLAACCVKVEPTGLWRMDLPVQLRHAASPNVMGEQAVLVALRACYAELVRGAARGDRRKYLRPWLKVVYVA